MRTKIHIQNTEKAATSVGKYFRDNGILSKVSMLMKDIQNNKTEWKYGLKRKNMTDTNF